MKDRREYVRIAVDLPENPKLVDAPVSAKWLYVAALCYAGAHLTDGHVPITAALSKAGVPRKWLADLVTRDVLHEPGHQCKECDQPRAGSVVIHDYLEHQRSRSDAETARRAGKAGAKARWDAKGNADRNAHRNADRIPDGNADRSAKGNAVPNATPNAEVEVEVEVEGGLGSQSPNGRSTDRTSDGLDLDRIKNALRTGHRRAEAIAGQILAKAPRPPGDPTAYVVEAIQREPHLYRETSGPPALDQLCDHGRDAATCPWPDEHGGTA